MAKDKNQKPQITFFDPQGEIAKKFDFYIKIVVGVLVVAVLTMLFMVAGVLLDAWHFNSAVYKEYSAKTGNLESLQEANKLLLEQNTEGQKLMLEQQEQIKLLLEQNNENRRLMLEHQEQIDLLINSKND